MDLQRPGHGSKCLQHPQAMCTTKRHGAWRFARRQPGLSGRHTGPLQVIGFAARALPQESLRGNARQAKGGLHPGQDDLNLRKALQPAKGQRHLLFDDLMAVLGNRNRFRPDRQAQPVTLRDGGKRASQFRSEIDIRRAVAAFGHVKGGIVQIEADIGAATGRKAFEPHRAGADGRHRVGLCQNAREHRGRHIEPRSDDFRHGPQCARGFHRIESARCQEMPGPVWCLAKVGGKGQNLTAGNVPQGRIRGVTIAVFKCGHSTAPLPGCQDVPPSSAMRQKFGELARPVIHDGMRPAA